MRRRPGTDRRPGRFSLKSWFWVALFCCCVVLLVGRLAAVPPGMGNKVRQDLRGPHGSGNQDEWDGRVRLFSSPA